MKSTGFIENICGILGGAVIIVSIFLFAFIGLPSMQKMNRSNLVTGEIVGYIDESVREHNDNGTYEKIMYCPVYGYTYEGNYYEIKSDGSTSFRKPVGTLAELYVDPEEPEKGSEKTSLVMMTLIPMFVMFLGIFFFMVFVFGRIGRKQGVSNRYLLRISGFRTVGMIFVAVSGFFIAFFSVFRAPIFITLGFGGLFMLVGIVLIANERRLYEGKREKPASSERSFTTQADMIRETIETLNTGNHSYLVSSPAPDELRIGLRWMNGIYADRPMAVSSASSYFEHIIVLDEKTKTYSAMDVMNRQKTTASMMSGKLNMNMQSQTGVVHETIYMKIFGYDKDTGRKGLITYSLKTDEIRWLLDDFVESYGYKRKG